MYISWALQYVIGESNRKRNRWTPLPHRFRSKWGSLKDYCTNNRTPSLSCDSVPYRIPRLMLGFCQGPPRHRYVSWWRILNICDHNLLMFPLILLLYLFDYLKSWMQVYNLTSKLLFSHAYTHRHMHQCIQTHTYKHVYAYTHTYIHVHILGGNTSSIIKA